ncbi:hypothetical protein [Geodermatophilus sabuli]|uniref:Uncharacterized protein n=1 Tax=Geodermatophilus sabuli TaxID=1564158 RepID=A0A285EE83_9ACTN|nr:hypothetical protein [Geodermatophilus sabuli]MBB3084345.1 hypothetical protein [Geodermatophilus sabuli]SNX96386.1 hypothetical protein SAMN06893097_104100 [Geodermatophilus sabuli]
MSSRCVLAGPGRWDADHDRRVAVLAESWSGLLTDAADRSGHRP